MHGTIPGDSLLEAFFHHVTWPAVKSVIFELATPAELPGWKERLQVTFSSLVGLKIAGEVERLERIARLKAGIEASSNVPGWISTFTWNTIDEHSSSIARVMEMDGSTRAVEEVVRDAAIIDFFACKIWPFVRGIVVMEARVNVATLGEIKDKLEQVTAHVVAGSISLQEARNATFSFLGTYPFASDVARELACSHVACFLETVVSSSLHELHGSWQKDLEFDCSAERDRVLDVEARENKQVVITWFINDVLAISLKSLEELYPEFTSQDIVDWKKNTVDALELLLEDIITFDDFETRILSLFKSPRLTFDIENQLSDDDIVDEFIDLENRGSLIESVLACAELVDEKRKEDPFLAGFARELQQRSWSKDRLYS